MVGVRVEHSGPLLFRGEKKVYLHVLHVYPWELAVMGNSKR